MRDGLIPSIGKRSEGIETIPAIHLSNSIEDMETALGQWLGMEFDDYRGELHSLKVSLPSNFQLRKSCEWESISYDIIPSRYISYFRNEG